MIFDKCIQWRKYAPLGKDGILYTAFEELMKLDADTPEGRIEIIPDKLFINVFSYDAKAEENIKIEIHGRYTDIQRVLQGVETGICTSVDGREQIERFDTEKDCAFYCHNQSESVHFELNPETFAVFMPGEGHSCCRKNDCGRIKKAVVKVLL